MKERKPPPVADRLPALGFPVPASLVCVRCADRITISPQADAFVSVAAELVRTQQWLRDGRQGAADRSWSWLQFARWKAHQPLLGDGWEDLIRVVRGKRWAEAASTLRGVVATHRSESETVARLPVASIGDDPGRSAVLERAIRAVETGSRVLEESATVLKISGCDHGPYTHELFPSRRPRYQQPSPWHVVADTWRGKVKRGGPLDIRAVARSLDAEFPHVHDLYLLQGGAPHDPPVAGDSIHTWALRTAQAHRRALIEQWVNRLDTAASGLFDAHSDASDTCTHLVCIPWWPMIRDGMDSVAYLAQFEVVCGPFQLDLGEYELYRAAVAVVRVPGWAAAHAAGLRTPPLRSEPIVDERRQAIALARQEGVSVVGDEFTARRNPSQLVLDARQATDRSG
jgi:hypothetical protein